MSINVKNSEESLFKKESKNRLMSHNLLSSKKIAAWVSKILSLWLKKWCQFLYWRQRLTRKHRLKKLRKRCRESSENFLFSEIQSNKNLELVMTWNLPHTMAGHHITVDQHSHLMKYHQKKMARCPRFNLLPVLMMTIKIFQQQWTLKVLI